MKRNSNKLQIIYKKDFKEDLKNLQGLFSKQKLFLFQLLIY